jgi:glucose-6-phosphate 1-dehydrogenase
MEAKMGTTKSQQIEKKQDILKDLDPEKEASLEAMFVDYVGGVYHDPNTTREEKQQEVEEAEVIYEKTLDDAIRDEAEMFLSSWDLGDEATRADLYPYLKDYAKDWINQREKTNQKDAV